MRVFIVDNNAKEFLGHPFNMDLGLRRSFGGHHVAATAIIHRNSSPEVRDALDAVAVLPDASWGDLDDPDPNHAMEDFAARFADALAGAARPGPEDWLLLPTAFQEQVLGTARFLDTLPKRQRPRVLAVVHWANWRDDPKYLAPWQKAAARLLHAAGRTRVVFATLTEGVAAGFTAVTDHPAAIMPAPQYFGEPPSGQAQAAHPRRVGVLGRPLARKGSHLVPGIIRNTKMRRPLTRFRVQVSDDAPRLRRLGRVPGVELLDGGLSHADYMRALDGVDVVLMPYRREDYRDRLSGPMMEAAALGKVVVVPEGTWLSDQISRGHAAGTAFSEQSARGVAEALLRALGDLPRLSEEAKRRSGYWWTRQGVDAFVEAMLERDGTGTPVEQVPEPAAS